MNRFKQIADFSFWAAFTQAAFFALIFTAFFDHFACAADPTNGDPIGEPFVWDFTENLPAAGTLRGGTLQGGLLPASFDPAVSGGFELADEKFPLPEAFRFEAQIAFGDPLPDVGEDKNASNSGIIWDSMYVTYKKEPPENFNRGFQVMLKKAGENSWRPALFLGYGDSTHELTGPIAEIAPNQSVTLAFDYDANGSVFWDFCGIKSESRSGFLGAPAPSRFKPVIGDRIGANFDPFPGKIERVTITPRQREPLAINVVGRKVFYRGEKEAALGIGLIRAGDETFESLRLAAELLDADGENVLARFEQDAASLLTDNATITLPLETRLATGRYPLRLTLTAKRTDGTETVISRAVEIGIGPIFSDRFFALMWNFCFRPFEEVKAFGFTHGIDTFVPRSFNAGIGEKQLAMERFDGALLSGLPLVSHVGAIPPGGPADSFYRVGSDGKIVLSNRKPMLEVLNPEVVEYTRKTAEQNAQLFGNHPGFAGILANTERRDHVAPSFQYQPERYKADTGLDIPPEAVGPMPAREIGKERFPDGLIPEDDPLLNYYRWFWNGGDGWPQINTVIADTYREKTKPPFFSFFDPAVRVPPKWGSGGNVDVLSQWIYAVPEPLAVAGPVEELFAMAAGNHQQVMIMTQIICYRNQIAPKDKEVSPSPAWVAEKPDADFPTIPPDSLQEATWAMIAKPVRGIMYHGYQCIVETGAKTGYTFTNAETPKRLTRLLNDTLAPLGPTLNKLPREDSPVAVLESFSNALFSGYATWGWKAPDLLFLQRARLDPRVVYDETILRDGFGGAKVLYMPQCEFLSAKVFEKIVEFQKNGGILIGDDKLLSAITPDIKWSVQDREDAIKRNRLDTIDETAAEANDVAAQKSKMNAEAAALREKLAPFYTPRADSSSPELITFSRRWNNVDYLFVINDHRTYGDYVGQWKMTMEKGLPFDGFVTLAEREKEDGKIGAVYELSRGESVPFTRTENGAVRVDLKYETNDGRLLMFLERSIHEVALDVPESVTRGETVCATFRVMDNAQNPIQALLPVEVRLFDSNGRELDGAGYACAEGGVLTLEIPTNLNDPAGEYRVTARDRASGLAVEKTILAK